MYNIIKSDLLDDISSLTTIQKISLDRLAIQANKCICHDIQEAIVDKSSGVCINIGIGNLFIDMRSDEIKYRFEPSSKLENCIVDTVLTGKSPIIDDIEKSLINKVNTVYKELFWGSNNGKYWISFT